MKYFWLTLKHKWFVFIAGVRIGVPLWRLLTHDLSKFSASELPAYQRQFFGKADRPGEFVRCWLHHQNRNDHHWEYWIPRTGHNRCEPPYPDNVPIEMAYDAALEMVADWLGASRAYEGQWPTDRWPWLEANWDKVKANLHPETVKIIVHVLTQVGYGEAWYEALSR